MLRQASVVCMDHGWQRQLMSIMHYAAATHGCRRAILAAEFAEPAPTCNSTCDLCVAAAAAAAAAASTGQQQQQQQVDLTEQAGLVVQVLQVSASCSAVLGLFMIMRMFGIFLQHACVVAWRVSRGCLTSHTHCSLGAAAFIAWDTCCMHAHALAVPVVLLIVKLSCGCLWWCRSARVRSEPR